MESIDQIVVDFEQGFIDFREARTIGTSKEHRYTYKDGEFGSKAQVFQSDSSSRITVISSDARHALVAVFERSLNMEFIGASVASVNAFGVLAFTWRCQE